MKELQFQQIPLKDITPDPNQPRKFYEEQAMQELTNSVKESGVLQPILVREQPDGSNKYIVVCGERRYRASVAAKLKTIPAVIRELTDEEALQLQIVENLHRKDVHPMEEAVAFKSFVECKEWSFDEIAKRVGKSEYYVKQRLKLNSLVEQFQNLFYQNKMNIKSALDLAQFPETTQLQIFEDQIDEDDLNNDRYEFKLNDYMIANYKGKLKDATFDLSDENLINSAGACTACQFNSSVASLFPDESPRCNNISCFKSKQDVAFTTQLKIAKEDPTLIYVCNSYSNLGKSEQKLFDSLNIEVINRIKYDNLDQPEYPDMDEYKEELKGEYYDTHEEMMEAFNRAVKDYEKEIVEYNESIYNGKYLKAFIVDGSGKGSYIYINLTGKQNGIDKLTANATATQTDTKFSTEDIEIERLTYKEKRSKELDEAKIYGAILTDFTPTKVVDSNTSNNLTDSELQAVAWAIYDKLDWKQKGLFLSRFGFKDDKGITDVSPSMLTSMLRFFMADVLARPAITLTSGHNKFSKKVMELAEFYFPVQFLQATDNLNLSSEKRIKKVEARIAELNKMKAEIIINKTKNKQNEI